MKNRSVEIPTAKIVDDVAALRKWADSYQRVWAEFGEEQERLKQEKQQDERPKE